MTNLYQSHWTDEEWQRAFDYAIAHAGDPATFPELADEQEPLCH